MLVLPDSSSLNISVAFFSSSMEMLGKDEVVRHEDVWGMDV
jgi:hypothetical protein